MPNDLGRLLSLQKLLFLDNLLQDDFKFISSLTNCSDLQVIVVSNNLLSGPLPDCIGNLSTNMTYMVMDNNRIHGKLPSGIGNLRNLGMLTISMNELTGPIPTSIGNLPSLIQLHLHANNLTGVLPSSLGNLSLLNSLFLHQNKILGSIPPSLGQILGLLELDLSRNKLNGSIPREITSISSISVLLSLAHNALTGTLPLEIGALKNLAELDVSNNRLSGSLPNSLGNALVLQRLYLDRNSFVGEIPQGWSALKGLQELDLSNNNLSGKIPSYLGELRLEKLNLSSNRPNGEVPKQGVFLNASAVSLVGNSNLCGGIIDLKLPPCPSPNAKKLWHGIQGNSWSIRDDSGCEGAQSSKKRRLEKFHVRMQSITINKASLLKILSACSSVDFQGNDFKAPIYEFMANGNLDEWLHQDEVEEDGQQQETKILTLIQRLNIAMDIALALEYLHCGNELPIVHGGLKPSNVLLDDELKAQIGDFGLAKVVSAVTSGRQSKSVAASNSNAVHGTIGYVAPEYGMASAVSTTGDMYSYGILVIEMFTRKKPTDATFKDDLSLHAFVQSALPDQAMEIVDPHILCDHDITSGIKDCIVSILSIGVACSAEEPRNRMLTGELVSELRKLHEFYAKEVLNQE
ncbi:hypothetical protein RJ640_022413 [Escallonia rubra]|uniref:non-specific serine/threonine protein kinase n=1 Tax=Escallonia rubra TaxID=112253 RepID=A0AA88QMR1_9ASTE|nr:hypothetical protein RJ640_022413 [Escallonia rubra]